ncbi:hypothetical protein ACFPIJ_11320 [Dactylosporangium cerinum]|uniref:Uncharacterized protein n=1 Tax=Dactylosporangium cerinum TaxID=1434730 RepID=A0ABV9VRL0_9ACTN
MKPFVRSSTASAPPLPLQDQASQPMPRDCAVDRIASTATVTPLWVQPNSPTMSGIRLLANQLM